MLNFLANNRIIRNVTKANLWFRIGRVQSWGLKCLHHENICCKNGAPVGDVRHLQWEYVNLKTGCQKQSDGFNKTDIWSCPVLILFMVFIKAASYTIQYGQLVEKAFMTMDIH